MKQKTASKKSFHKQRLYKLLSQCRGTEFLRLIWAVISFQSGRPKVASKFLEIPNVSKKIKPDSEYFIGSWSLETLVNEFFLAPTLKRNSIRRLNCSAWASFAKIYNSLNNLENAESLEDIDDNKLLNAMQRLAWRQFPWQSGFMNGAQFYRAWSLYNFPEANVIFEEKYGISIERFTFCGFAVRAAVNEYPAVSEQISRDQIGITDDEWKKFLDVASLPIMLIKSETASLRNRRNQVAYEPSILRKFPIIRITEDGNNNYYVPIPDLVVSRITDGLFYDIVADDNVRRLAGENFEKYVFQLLNYYIKNRTVVSEFKYRTIDSPDFQIVTNNSEIEIVIECKARRLPMSIRGSAAPFDNTNHAYQELIKGIVQIWKYCSHIRSGKVTGKTMTLHKSTVGILLTLEPWFEMGNQVIDEVISCAIENSKRDNNILEVDRIPISFLSIDDLERTLGKGSEESLVISARTHAEDDSRGWLLDAIQEKVIESHNLTPSGKSFPYLDEIKKNVDWWRRIENP